QRYLSEQEENVKFPQTSRFLTDSAGIALASRICQALWCWPKYLFALIVWLERKKKCLEMPILPRWRTRPARQCCLLLAMGALLPRANWRSEPGLLPQRQAKI